LSANNHITSSCIISNQAVCKNGTTIFENKGADAYDFLLSAYQHFGLNYPKFYKMDSLSKLGWLASEILLKDVFNKEDYRPEDIGIVLTNANASLDTDIKYLTTVKEIPSPSLFVYTLPNIVMGEICIRNNFKGENAFFIFEKFDAAFIEQYVSNLMNRDVLQACICGWTDLLEDEYKAFLLLVEKKQTVETVAFTKEAINKIFDTEL
jgi:hypothetical protein